MVWTTSLDHWFGPVWTTCLEQFGVVWTTDLDEFGPVWTTGFGPPVWTGLDRMVKRVIGHLI